MNPEFGMIPRNQPFNNPFNLVEQQLEFNQNFLAPVYDNAVNASSLDNYDHQQQQQESENFFGVRPGTNYAESCWGTDPLAPAGYGNFDPQFSTMNSEFVWSSLPAPTVSDCQQEHPQDETFSMNLEFDRSNLPPGFRFCPTNKELIVHYLYKKVRKEPLPTNEIPEINLYKYDPEDFKAEFPQNGEDKWYFFTQRISTSDTEKRAKRTTPNGFWRMSTNGPIPGTAGRNNTLVYHCGKQGKKTNWIMHEYMLDRPIEGQKLKNWVLCCIYKKKEKDAQGKQDQEKENCASEKAETPIGNQETDDIDAFLENILGF